LHSSTEKLELLTSEKLKATFEQDVMHHYRLLSEKTLESTNYIIIKQSGIFKKNNKMKDQMFLGKSFSIHLVETNITKID